jgi:four helix bundle protein
MATVTKLEELEIWQLARSFADEIRSAVKADIFGKEIGLRNQILNASGSVMDNIAEGFGRRSRNEFINHLTIARGSLEETRSQLYRCYDAELINDRAFNELLTTSELLVKKITVLTNYLNRTTVKGTKFKDRS